MLDYIVPHSRLDFTIRLRPPYQSFFKLLTLNLNTVSVHHYPVRDGIFFCQFPQLAFSDTEIFCCFFYGKSVLFPNRHVVIVQFVVPLS